MAPLLSPPSTSTPKSSKIFPPSDRRALAAPWKRPQSSKRLGHDRVLPASVLVTY